MYLNEEIQMHRITIHMHANDFFTSCTFYMFMNNFAVLFNVVFFYCRFILERFSPETVLVLIL